MNGAIFLMLLIICSILTGLITECEKMLMFNFKANIMAMITGVVVGVLVPFVYYLFNGIGYTSTNIAYWILMACGSGVGSMIGYDKVIQAIQQIKLQVPDDLPGKDTDD